MKKAASGSMSGSRLSLQVGIAEQEWAVMVAVQEMKNRFHCISTRSVSIMHL